MKTIYPWQESKWDEITGRIKNHTLPHALLLTGPAGIGKKSFSFAMVQNILCEVSSGKDFACGQCKSCLLIKGDTHPDIKFIQPSGKSITIGVDQIRELIHYVSLTPHMGKRKIALIHDAEKMNTNAANSLLKSLEEPPQSSLILLVSSRHNTLLPTIRSRCQVISLPLPTQDVAEKWLSSNMTNDLDNTLLLALSQGAPLSALALSQDNILHNRLQQFNQLTQLSQQKNDPVSISAYWLKFGAEYSIYWLNTWIKDMAKLKVSTKSKFLNNPDLQQELQQLSQHIPLKKILTFQLQTENAAKLLRSNMNQELLLEDILINWVTLTRQGAKQ